MLKTNNIGISPSRLAELLIALTVICKVSSLLAPFSFKEIILYINIYYLKYLEKRLTYSAEFFGTKVQAGVSYRKKYHL